MKIFGIISLLINLSVFASGNHELPTHEHIEAHEIDRARPHSMQKQINGIEGHLLYPIEGECRPCGTYKMRSKYFHPGQDLCTDKKGVPTRAIYTGIAVEVTDHCTDDFWEGKSWQNKSMNCKNSRGFGNRIMLMHKTGDQIWYSGYHHLGDVYIKNGDVVLAGEEIGTVGSTGVSFNYHLHFEIINGDNPGAYSHVRNDPLKYYKSNRMCGEYFYTRAN